MPTQYCTACGENVSETKFCPFGHGPMSCRENEEIERLEAEHKILASLLEEARDTFVLVNGDDLRQYEWERYQQWRQECDDVLIGPPTPGDD